MPRPEVGGAQAVLRAIDVLDCFLGERSTLSVGEVTAAVGLTTSTTHRLMRALVSRGLLSVEPGSRHYSLGPSMLKYSTVILRQADDIVPMTMPVLQRLRELTGETVGLHWRVGSQRVCIAELPSHQPLRTESGVGFTYPLTAGSASKAILAWLPAAEQDSIIEVARTSGVGSASLEQLKRSLSTVRETGYAVTRGETTPGAIGVAVPLVTPDRSVVAAINVTGPASRLSDDRIESISGALIGEVGRLSALCNARALDHEL